MSLGDYLREQIEYQNYQRQKQKQDEYERLSEQRDRDHRIFLQESDKYKQLSLTAPLSEIDASPTKPWDWGYIELNRIISLDDIFLVENHPEYFDHRNKRIWSLLVQKNTRIAVNLMGILQKMK